MSAFCPESSMSFIRSEWLAFSARPQIGGGVGDRCLIYEGWLGIGSWVAVCTRVVVMHRAPSLSLSVSTLASSQQPSQQLVLALQRPKSKEYSSRRQAGRMVSSLSFLLSRYFGSHCLRITKETHFRRRCRLDYLIEWATRASQLKQLAGEQTAFCKKKWLLLLQLLRPVLPP